MSASKFNIEPNGGIFDVSAENDRASPNVKTTICRCAFSLRMSDHHLCTKLVLSTILGKHTDFFLISLAIFYSAHVRTSSHFVSRQDAQIYDARVRNAPSDATTRETNGVPRRDLGTPFCASRHETRLQKQRSVVIFLTLRTQRAHTDIPHHMVEKHPVRHLRKQPAM